MTFRFFNSGILHLFGISGFGFRAFRQSIALPIVGLSGALLLLLVCFRRVLFEDGQFVHFDASFFYYPLYLRVQQEWAAGRWPLWDPGQNGGTPLLGNPV